MFELKDEILSEHEFFESLPKHRDYKLYKQKKSYYINLSCSFDIETTSFYNEKGEKQSTMYAFVVGVNGKCTVGRTWNQFLNICQKLTAYFDLSNNKRLIIYVHNLAFEFQFIRKLFEWTDVFCLKEREPVKALTTSGIEFRCSYILSGYSLEKVGEHLLTYKIKKLVGDLDYKLLRHSETPLTTDELNYIKNDSLVVMAYIQEEMEKNGNITKIPLTKTGYVRRYCRNQCLYGGIKDHKKKAYNFCNYTKIIHNINIKSVQELEQLYRAYCGGFTHANCYNVDKVIDDVVSYDFISSYPSVMVSYAEYPMSNATLVQNISLEEFYKNITKYACVFDIVFYNLRPKIIWENPLSESKSFIKGNKIINNGRVVKGDLVITTLTNIDFKLYEKFYSWDKIVVKNFRYYYKSYLPKAFVKSILDLYKTKTELKGVDSMEREYLASKEMLNSCYGMCVTDICKPDIKYENGEFVTYEVDKNEKLNDYNNNKTRFLCYQWGIWVTALARYNLFSGIYELQEDYCYSDTDSIKFMNHEKHKKYIQEYNKKQIERLQKAMNFHHFDFELVAPKTIKGDIKILGLWESDGVYKKFKTMGAKRYMYITEDEKINLTVSGLNKKTAIPYLLDRYKDKNYIIDKIFNDNLFIPKNATGKMIHTYIDDEIKGILTDYKGSELYYNELSCIHLEECEFTLNVNKQFADFLNNIQCKIGDF